MEAETVLRRLRGPHYDVSVEIKDMNEKLELSNKPKISWSAVFTKVRLRSLMICFGLMVSIISKDSYLFTSRAFQNPRSPKTNQFFWVELLWYLVLLNVSKIDYNFFWYWSGFEHKASVIS